jgi:hypothetical protein
MRQSRSTPVSVIIPNYNREHIPQAIDSILRAVSECVEIIVVGLLSFFRARSQGFWPVGTLRPKRL